MRSHRAITHRPPSGGRAHSRTRGFTLVELVVVMLVMAIVVTVGATRFADRDAFAVQGAADQLVSGLRLAQGIAVAQRQAVYVRVAASPAQLSVCRDSACSQPLATPSGDTAWLVDAGDLLVSTAASFSFGPDGSPSLASSLSLQVRNADGSVSSQPVVVEAVSGNVHNP